LELRFAGARLIESQAVDKLARSIERDGQIVPLIAVGGYSGAKDGKRLVFIDGYRRVAAHRASLERWPCDLAEAVMGVLVRTQGRSFAAIEEALLLRELTQGLGITRCAQALVSQREAAMRCGRDVSWVNRRLQLLSALSEATVVAVREGRLSTWSAARVIAPLARANSAHCTGPF
jgi:hypothetical protein